MSSGEKTCTKAKMTGRTKIKKNLWTPIPALLFFWFFSFPTLALGYEAVPVENGGTVEGKVFLEGETPPARVFHLIASPNIEFCGKVSDGKGNRLLQEFRAGRDGGFQNVVVALVGVERGKPFDHAPRLSVEHCRISPFVTAVRNDHSIRLVNNDPIVHDIQTYTLDGKGRVFEIFKKRLAPELETSKTVLLRGGHHLFHAQCGVHAYMQAWGIALGNPYFAVTGEDGSFRIDEIPPGTYDVIAWHPHLEIQARRVSVRAGEKTTLDHRFDVSGVEIPLHDLQTGYRFKPVLQPSQVVFPEVEYQRP